MTHVRSGALQERREARTVITVMCEYLRHTALSARAADDQPTGIQDAWATPHPAPPDIRTSPQTRDPTHTTEKQHKPARITEYSIRRLSTVELSSVRVSRACVCPACAVSTGPLALRAGQHHRMQCAWRGGLACGLVRWARAAAPPCPRPPATQCAVRCSD